VIVLLFGFCARSCSAALAGFLSCLLTSWVLTRAARWLSSSDLVLLLSLSCLCSGGLASNPTSGAGACGVGFRAFSLTGSEGFERGTIGVFGCLLEPALCGATSLGCGVRSVSVARCGSTFIVLRLVYLARYLLVRLVTIILILQSRLSFGLRISIAEYCADKRQRCGCGRSVADPNCSPIMAVATIRYPNVRPTAADHRLPLESTPAAGGNNAPALAARTAARTPALPDPKAVVPRARIPVIV